MREALCKAFCDGLYIAEVPIGYAVATAFKQADGDRVGFFVRRSKRDPLLSRLEDDGMTVPMLMGSGVDLLESTRAIAFAELLHQAGADFDPDEGVMHTKYLPESALPAAALRFMVLLIRMQDFMLITRERVSETFKGDVIAAVTSRFNGRAAVQVDVPLRPEFWETPPDITIRPDNALPLALFLVTSNNKTLESTILDLKANRLAVPTAKIMNVLPTEKPRSLTRKGRSLAQNIPYTVFPGREEHALDDMEVLLFGKAHPLFSNPVHVG